MNSDAREERGKVRDSPNIEQRYAVSLLDFCPACASCCFSNYYCLVVNFLFHPLFLSHRRRHTFPHCRWEKGRAADKRG